MTLKALWYMATAHRERGRTHAVDIAIAVSTALFSKDKRINWDRFIKTGKLKAHEPVVIPMTPLIQKRIDRIRKNGGRFVLEDN